MLGDKFSEICENQRLQNIISAFLKFKFNFEWLFLNFDKASREKVLLQRLLPSRRSPPSSSFLTLLLLCCHPGFKISQCQCNRGSVAVSYPHTFLSLEDSLRAFESTKQFCSKSLESFIMGEYILIVFKWFSKKLMGMANYKMVPFIYCRNK